MRREGNEGHVLTEGVPHSLQGEGLPLVPHQANAAKVALPWINRCQLWSANLLYFSASSLFIIWPEVASMLLILFLQLLTTISTIDPKLKENTREWHLWAISHVINLSTSCIYGCRTKTKVWAGTWREYASGPSQGSFDRRSIYCECRVWNQCKKLYGCNGLSTLTRDAVANEALSPNIVCFLFRDK